MRIKFIFLYFIILLFFFFYGIFTERYQIFPYKTLGKLKIIIYDKFIEDSNSIFNDYYQKYPNFLEKKINLVKYYSKANIWTDRIYYNHENDEELLNFYLIQIKRHQKQNINIKLNEDLTIYRAICDLNNNSIYNDWEKVEFKIAIVGSSCVHNKIIKKQFKKGSVYLKSGGPISSDPIFVQGLSSRKSIIIK